MAAIARRGGRRSRDENNFGEVSAEYPVDPTVVWSRDWPVTDGERLVR